VFAASVAVIGGGTYAYNVLVASKHAVTDNAYVGADVAQGTPLSGGPVKAVSVQDTQQVRRGDVLVRLDDTDAKIAVAQAEANLASAIRKVQGLHATDSGLDEPIAARDADTARTDNSTLATGVGAPQAARAQAAATRNAAVGDRDANRALIANSTVDNNPEVLAARAALAQARVDLQR